MPIRLRYYLWLPLGRLADMWLRPRVENLYDDLDWWAYARHPLETRISWALCRIERPLFTCGCGRTSVAPPALAVDSGLHGAA